MYQINMKWELSTLILFALFFQIFLVVLANYKNISVSLFKWRMQNQNVDRLWTWKYNPIYVKSQGHQLSKVFKKKLTIKDHEIGILSLSLGYNICIQSI